MFILINRAKFDSKTKKAYKSNDFTEFYDSIYLDRYMANQEHLVIDKRRHVMELRSELALLSSELQRVLTGVCLVLRKVVKFMIFNRNIQIHH